MEIFDVAIVGAGPAGSTCAAFCAAAGLRTVLIEREKFPREKVCGDCLNPACWPVLDRLAITDQVRVLPHGQLDRVEFISINGRTTAAELPQGHRSEIAVKRSLLDHLLLNRARELAAEIVEGAVVTAISQLPAQNWKIDIVRDTLIARVVVAADGRNSTVARLCNLLPTASRERVALQTHIPLPPDFGNRVVLQFLPEGYSGQAPVNDRELNLCLVGKPSSISSLRAWAERRFGLPTEQPWRTITPLTRPPIHSVRENLFFIGDAARVVEPFTGEGIYYALRSGELGAEAIAKMIGGSDASNAMREFIRAHTAMYRGRLWINRLARLAVLSPRVASRLIDLPLASQLILRSLTSKIVEAA
jgi:geranylgeranyl reductase family protein